MTDREKAMVEKLTNDFRNWLISEVEDNGFFWDFMDREDDDYTNELVSILFESKKKGEIEMDICWC